jgi:predicted kinase
MSAGWWNSTTRLQGGCFPVIEMPLSLIIFSGLPGTGKSILANRLARDLHLPLLRIDDLAACMPPGMNREETAFWDGAIAAMLLLAKAQLELGVSVILDSIFMNLERFHARAIARQSGARFLPVYTFISDEVIWNERVTQRSAASKPEDGLASWEQVQMQQRWFRKWEAGTAIFLDAVRPEEENYAALRDALMASTPLVPLPEVAFTPGRYHNG